MDILSAEKWNAAARDYQRAYKLGQNDYNNAVIDFWEQSGMLKPGMRVLDIGCGVGKYGASLARRGYDVTLTDISSQMLRHAEKNMAEFTTPWQIYCCDFALVKGNEDVFQNGFDFSLSTMSPAIKDAETIRMMSRLTNGWCFISRFRDWKQPLRDTIIQKLGWEARTLFGDLEADCDSMIQAVSAAGFVPYVKTVDYDWFDLRTPEDLADYMTSHYYDGDKDIAVRKKSIIEAARDLCNAEGFLVDAVNTKVDWIYWNAQE